MRKTDYAYNGKKTIVYYEDEKFRIYPKTIHLLLVYIVVHIVSFIRKN